MYHIFIRWVKKNSSDILPLQAELFNETTGQ